MTVRDIARILKPNLASLGYALFLAVNAAGVWGGVFPFLPLDFQTPTILFWFFLAQALVFSASFFASAVGVYFWPGPTRAFLVKLSSLPYLLGWAFLIAAIYLEQCALPLATLGGALLGLGSAGFYMLWQRLFASQDPERGNRDLMVGTTYASLLYFLLYLVPSAVTAFLIPLVFLPLFGLSIVLKSREIDRDQPMFQDVPRENPQVYKQVLRDCWRNALCLGALGFCAGVMRSMAIGQPETGTLVNVLSMAATLVISLTLLWLWQFKNIHINVTKGYRIAFPLVISLFLLLPFLSEIYGRCLAALLHAAYSVSIVLMMIQCAQVSRDRGTNPVFVYGFFGGIVYALHDLGFIGGRFAENVEVTGIAPVAVVALVAVYLLGLMYFVGYGGFGNAVRGRDDDAGSIELVALAPRRNETELRAKQASACSRTVGDAKEGSNRPEIENGGHRETETSIETPPACPAEGAMRAEGEPKRRRRSENEPAYRDRISKQVALLQRHYRLTSRETEVMEYIARGTTVSRIAQELVMSENTVRTHAKRIYAKLAVHKRQELIDLVNEFDPKDLAE